MERVKNQTKLPQAVYGKHSYVLHRAEVACKPFKAPAAIWFSLTLSVQINTIKKAIKMAKDSGMTVKYKEDKKGDSYKITIELLKK